MKLWVDDLRPPPDGTWHWVKTSSEAISVLLQMKDSYSLDGTPPEIMSLDHDLGGLDTTRPVVLWCCENNFWPDEVRIHTMNPVGRTWLAGMVERYKP
jgi:hypothetical protein